MYSVRTIVFVIGLFVLLLCSTRVGTTQTTCNPTWVSTTAYTAGMKVSLNGINYTANFWTQGQSPPLTMADREVVNHGPATGHAADRVAAVVADRARPRGTQPLFTTPATLQASMA